MNKLFLLLTFALSAQTFAADETATTDNFPTEEQRQQEREKLTARRQALEDQYKKDMKVCYQRFNVTSCRLEARDRRIEVNNELRKDELRFNAIERKINADESRRSVAERNSEAQRKELEAQRAASIATAKERADANAQKQIDHALQGTKRGEFEQKQREAAQHRADLEKKLSERTKPPAASLPPPGTGK
jgi:hypothetical protein